MTKRIITSAILLTIGVTMNAQTLKGIVVDENNKPLEFVNIAILNAKDSAFVNGVISGLDGTFSIPDIKESQMLRFSIVGYKQDISLVPMLLLEIFKCFPIPSNLMKS